MIWLVLGAAAILAAVPFVIEARKPTIGRAAREGAPGGFAKLSQGVTYYRWFGPARGPVIVAVHGLTTPSGVFHALADRIGKLGYRVLVYDLYGRGLSDAPAGPQTAGFFHRQLEDLLSDQGIKDDLTLMGYSMGGAIAATYAAAHADRMKRVILLASAGIETKESTFQRICRTTPFLGDWLFLMFARRRLAAAIADQTAAYDVHDIVSVQRAEHHRQGYFPAVLSSSRGVMAESTEAAHRAIGRAGIPAIAIWGKRDKVVPLSAVGLLSQWNRNTMQEVMDDADHTLPFSHADALAARLRDVLRE